MKEAALRGAEAASSLAAGLTLNHGAFVFDKQEVIFLLRPLFHEATRASVKVFRLHVSSAENWAAN